MSSIDLEPAAWPVPRRKRLSGDLRMPEPGETPLSQQEVLHGVRQDLIPEGPRARAAAFRISAVMVRTRVLVADITDSA